MKRRMTLNVMVHFVLIIFFAMPVLAIDAEDVSDMAESGIIFIVRDPANLDVIHVPDDTWFALKTDSKKEMVNLLRDYFDTEKFLAVIKNSQPGSKNILASYMNGQVKIHNYYLNE
ncbi:MAG: hypothetical protein ACI8ZB_003796 [Desulforhopalus sp.]|jgi:hypothetical protein